MRLPEFIPFDPKELLLGYQKRWVADDSPLKIAEKSRRTGLTWAEAADDVLIAGRAKSDGGSDVFYIGSNKEMAREFIDAAAMWAENFNQAAGQIRFQQYVFWMNRQHAHGGGGHLLFCACALLLCACAVFAAACCKGQRCSRC